MKSAIILFATLVGGCNQAPALPAPQSIEATPPPVGRYQFIGKQTYQNGTIEYSCLDTATGEIGYASIPADIKAAAKADFNCAN